MPIYEFVCENCGTDFEKILSFSSTSSPGCPVCESSQVTRQVGRPAIHFKGSGWYITDSKKDARKTNNGDHKNGSDESTSDSTQETKIEQSKTDAKADSSSGDSSKSESSTSESGKSTAPASTATAKSDT